MDFAGGAQTEAITALEDILTTAKPSEQTRRIKGMLARLLTHALDLADDSPLPQFQTARETLAALPAN